MDIAGISTLLSSIKTATDILNVLRTTDFSLEKAELKLKLSDLMSTLADVKMQAAQIQDVIKEKDVQIQELKKVLELKAKVIRERNAYYEINSEGNATGDPYCEHCWEVNNKLVHLYKKGFLNICPLCKNEYEARLTSRK